MLISKIQSNYFTNYNNQIQAAKNRANNLTSGEKPSKSDFIKFLPAIITGADIHFENSLILTELFLILTMKNIWQ